MAKKGRRGNGEGSVYRRADGRWVGQYLVEDAGSGEKKRRYVYGKTRRDAADRLKVAMARRDHEVTEAQRRASERRQKSVCGHIEEYLTNVASRVRPKMHRRYEDLYHCHVEGTRVGGKKLRELTSDDVRALYADRLATGYAPRTVEHLHVLLKSVIRQVFEDGLAQKNPVASVKPPRGAKKDIHPLIPEQVRTLLTAARDDRYHALYIVAVTAGLRRGELLGLIWEDVDLLRGTLQVRRTLQGGQMLAPKTPKSRRQIRLTRRAVDALLDHRERQIKERAEKNGSWTEHGLVFPNRTGNPTDGDNLCSRHFKPLLKRSGLPSIRFHDLRHTCATLLLSRNVHPKIVSEMLGHATISITLDTYSHVIPSLGDVAANEMDDALDDDED